MRDILEEAAGGHTIYTARREEYETTQAIPFLVSPEPLYLSDEQARTIVGLGEAFTDYYGCVDELYRGDEELRTLLDRGKPDELTHIEQDAHYLFIRPDLIMTADGFSVCEIETSPFGLALSDIINRAYIRAGFETMSDEHSLTQHVQDNTPNQGKLVYSDKTASYSGQLAYLADNIFSGREREWQSGHVQDGINDGTAVYRGVYLSEYVDDPTVRALLDRKLQVPDGQDTLPSITPHLEEKALLALIWDNRYRDRIRRQIGHASFTALEAVIPHTWVVGQEKHFAPGMPHGVDSSLGLASLPASKRKFVLKPSGFSNDASWSEGVQFLHKRSANAASSALDCASRSKGLQIIQEFHKASDNYMHYENGDGQVSAMDARLRITPYYSMIGSNIGRLLTVKATGCEKTDFIHAGSGSINTAVSYN